MNTKSHTEINNVNVNGGYELNKTYHSSYWNSKFTVISIHNPNTYQWAVTVLWEDGHKTTHSTPRDKRDKEII